MIDKTKLSRQVKGMVNKILDFELKLANLVDSDEYYANVLGDGRKFEEINETMQKNIIKKLGE